MEHLNRHRNVRKKNAFYVAVDDPLETLGCT